MLVKEALATQILQAMQAAAADSTDGKTIAEIQANFADALALAIDTFVKSGTVSSTVTVAAGIPVQTVPVTGTGTTVTPGLGTANGTII